MGDEEIGLTALAFGTAQALAITCPEDRIAVGHEIGIHVAIVALNKGGVPSLKRCQPDGAEAHRRGRCKEGAAGQQSMKSNTLTERDLTEVVTNLSRTQKKPGKSGLKMFCKALKINWLRG